MLQVGCNFPLGLRFGPKKAIRVTNFSTDRLIADRGLPITQFSVGV
jgi:hypothetical protein